MNIQEIKNAIDNGKIVFHLTDNYQVIKDSLNQYLIKCLSNGYCIGLTNLAGDELNGDESDFYIGY